MTTLMILTAALFLIGIFTQILLNQNNLNFLLGNREGEVEESAIVGRTRRANNNLLESLPVFFALAILSLMSSIVERYFHLLKMNPLLVKDVQSYSMRYMIMLVSMIHYHLRLH